MTILVPRTRHSMTRSYADDLHLFRGPWSKFGLVLMVTGFVLLPMLITSDFWLSVLVYAGIMAIGGIGLNLLTGYTGQISLGHAFFIAAGSYCAARAGASGLPMPLWLLASGLVGAALGAVIGPFTLRLRGFYLAIVTLGLVFIGDHIWRNATALTGGNSGTVVTTEAALGPIDFAHLVIGGEVYSRNQGFFWLVWGIVALVAVAAKNLTRSRAGRAMQAIRDHDQAAEVIGVRVGRSKVAVFAISSAIAAMGGALFGSFQQFVSPDQWTLLLSVQYITVIIVGGLGTVYGAVLGALLIGGLPSVIERYSEFIPGVENADGTGFIPLYTLNAVLFGALIVAFVLFEPRGLAAIWQRVTAYFKTWPFSY